MANDVYRWWCSTWYLDNVAHRKWGKKEFYKVFQALQYFSLKQIPNKQWYITVFKGFVQEEGVKMCIH